MEIIIPKHENDKYDIVMKYIIYCPSSFKSASDRLKNDINFIINAATLGISLIQYAGSSILNNSNYILQLSYYDINAVYYANDDLKYNNPYILKLLINLTNNIELLKNANYELLNDFNFMYSILEINPNAIQYISYQLLNYKKFMLAIILNINKYFIHHCPDFIRNDGVTMHRIVKKYPDLLPFVNRNLQMNYNFNYRLFLANNDIINYIDRKLLQNEKFAARLIENNYNMFIIINKYVNNNINLCLLAIQLYYSDKFNNRLIYNNPYLFINLSIITNKYILTLLLNHDGLMLKYVPEEIKSKHKYAIIAINNNYLAYNYIYPNLKTNRKIIACAIRNNKKAIELFPESVLQNMDLVEVILLTDGTLLEHYLLREHQRIITYKYMAAKSERPYISNNNSSAKIAVKYLLNKKVNLEALDTNSRIYNIYQKLKDIFESEIMIYSSINFRENLKDYIFSKDNNCRVELPNMLRKPIKGIAYRNNWLFYNNILSIKK